MPHSQWLTTSNEWADFLYELWEEMRVPETERAIAQRAYRETLRLVLMPRPIPVSCPRWLTVGMRVEYTSGYSREVLTGEVSVIEWPWLIILTSLPGGIHPSRILRGTPLERPRAIQTVLDHIEARPGCPNDSDAF